MTNDAEAIVRDLFLEPDGRRHPYPHYHRLRDAAPVHRSTTLGAWLLTRYDACWAVLRDPRLGKNYARAMERQVGADWRRHPSLAQRERSMINVHGPDHTRLRRLVSKAFTRRTVEELRPAIARMVDALLEPLAARGGGEILDALAFPLPIAVIGELLGVPQADRAQFRDLVRDVTAVLETLPRPAQLAAADAAHMKIRAYFILLIAEKRRRPGSDLLSLLVQAKDDDRLTDDELESLASLLFAAGFETTTNLIGNGVLGLVRHPEQMTLLREDPSRFENLCDELLRYDGTAQLAIRYTLAPLEVGGVTIPTGESIMPLLGAGNHDPARFAEPDRLDVRRTGIEPLSFGGGVHYCLGAALARAEIETVFRALVERFGTIALDGPAPRFRDRLTLRGLESLHVALSPAASGRTATELAPPPSAVAATGPARLDTDRPVLEARPRMTDGGDAGWRNALRRRTEQDAAGIPHRTGPDLAATVALLGRASLFAGCTTSELEVLAATAYPVSFEPGERLCVEGGEALECYVIAEGEGTVSIGGRVVATVGENRVVGERGPLEGRARTATVTARTRMTTWAISRERLLALVAHSRAAADLMYEELHRRYAD
ncbi:MAG TPA: cytochrome P450 [Candidatus Eisenbacteria bacterium]|nr:cytochrome P450 [Candidatus Eisenbacteria bacterium]